MLLIDVLESLQLTFPLAPATVANYRRAVRYFSDFIGRDADTSDLNALRVNAWLASSESMYDPSYVISLRRDLLRTWNFAADSELCQHPKARLIRRSKFQQTKPTAWPKGWIAELIVAAERIEGTIHRWGIPRAHYADAYLRTAKDLLCRPTDMRRLLWLQLEGDGTIAFRQNKTGKPVKKKLLPSTHKAILRIRSERSHIFPLSKTATEVLICKLFALAGLEKPKGESLGHLRHTGGSHIRAMAGKDIAKEHLGHAPGSVVFDRHYLDPDVEPALESIDWAGIEA